jgi:hypothetical protein
VALAGAVATVGLVVAGLTVRDWIALRRATPVLTSTTAADVPAVLSASEVALVRARTLFARGRLAEALEVLDRVNPESAHRPAADALRLRIQDLLLAAAPPPRSAALEVGP